MITLYTFGPRFGLPDPSPFCMKAMVLLRMAGLEFAAAEANLRKAPKGKAPYLEDGGKIIADSTLIRFHLENAYGIDFDAGLNEAERGIAWAFEKLCEDNLYWAALHARWEIDRNFKAGPVQFFEGLPAPIRAAAVPMVRRSIRGKLKGHGFGLHSEAEIVGLAARGIDGIAAFLGDKPYLMGNTRCGADASVFATIAGLLVEMFDTPLVAATAKHTNLLAYRDRLMAEYFPDQG